MLGNDGLGTAEWERALRAGCERTGDWVPILEAECRFTHIAIGDVQVLIDYHWPQRAIEEMLNGPEAADRITRLAADIRETGGASYEEDQNENRYREAEQAAAARLDFVDEWLYGPTGPDGLDDDGNWPEPMERIAEVRLEEEPAVPAEDDDLDLYEMPVALTEAV